MLLQKNVTPKEERRLKDGVQKILAQAHSESSEQQNPRTAADLICPKVYLFFPHNHIRYLINIPLILNLSIPRSSKQCCSFTLPGHKRDFVLLHFSALRFLTLI